MVTLERPTERNPQPILPKEQRIVTFHQANGIQRELPAAPREDNWVPSTVLLRPLWGQGNPGPLSGVSLEVGLDAKIAASGEITGILLPSPTGTVLSDHWDRPGSLYDSDSTPGCLRQPSPGRVSTGQADCNQEGK